MTLSTIHIFEKCVEGTNEGVLAEIEESDDEIHGIARVEVYAQLSMRESRISPITAVESCPCNSANERIRKMQGHSHNMH